MQKAAQRIVTRCRAGELKKAQEILGMVLPADEDLALPLDPSEEALNEPAAHIADYTNPQIE
jgi:hypothetical protein